MAAAAQILDLDALGVRAESTHEAVLDLDAFGATPAAPTLTRSPTASPSATRTATAQPSSTPSPTATLDLDALHPTPTPTGTPGVVPEQQPRIAVAEAQGGPSPQEVVGRIPMAGMILPLMGGGMQMGLDEPPPLSPEQSAMGVAQ